MTTTPARAPQRRPIQQVAAGFKLGWALAVAGAIIAAGYRMEEPPTPVAAPLHPIAFGVPAPLPDVRAVPDRSAARPAPQPAPTPKPTPSPVQAPAPVTIAAPKPTVQLQEVAVSIPTVRVAVSTSIYDAQKWIDKCIGPVLFSWGTPVIGQHDYCGGWSTLGRHAVGDRVKVSGAGSLDGTWQVQKIVFVPKGSNANVLAGVGQLVFQTCRGDSSLQLTGLSKVS